MTDEEKQPEEEKKLKERKKRKGKPRRRGSGSVFRRPERKGGKQWVAQIILEDGRTRQRYFNTQEEADIALNEMLYEQRRGMLATGPNQTLKQYLENWLENVQKYAVRVNHYINTRTIIRKHILPTLGHIQLRQLNEQHIQALYAQKQDEKKSAKTIHHIHDVLHKALAQAVTWRLVSRNVCDGVTLPRLSRYEYQVLTAEQARKLLEVVRGHRFEVLLALALTTGMRLGELSSLHWQDMNFEQETVQVRRSVSRVRGQGYQVFEPKTQKSRRMLTLPSFVLDMLERHRASQDEVKQKAQEAGSQWQDHDLVFCNQYGSFLRPDRVRKQFQKLLAEAGLPHMRFHDLRHSAATILLSMGVPVKVVQEILGHSNISTTLNIYAHVLPTMQNEAMGKWDYLFGGQRPHV
jgi:integrase